MTDNETIPILWIYEYKDDESLVGATVYEGPLWEVPAGMPLPHLHPDYHYRVEILYEPKEDWV